MIIRDNLLASVVHPMYEISCRARLLALGNKGQPVSVRPPQWHTQQVPVAPLQMRASSMGINYEVMTAKAAEMLKESESKTAAAGPKAAAAVAAPMAEDTPPAKSAPTGDRSCALRVSARGHSQCWG